MLWVLALGAALGQVLPGEVLRQQIITDGIGLPAGVLAGEGRFGESVAALGDLDGDGVGDLAAGTTNDELYILFLNADGSVKGFHAIAAPEVPVDAGDEFGASVDVLGDLDGDAVVDIAVGAPGDDDGGLDANADRGALWILFLNADGTVKDSQKISDLDGGFGGSLGDRDRFGSAVTGLTDLDADTIPDVVVGAEGDDDVGTNFGALWVLFLNTDGTIKGQQKISGAAGGFGGALAVDDAFGRSVTSVGDLNVDGHEDIAVGAAPELAFGSEKRGRVWILFLGSDGTVTAEQEIGAGLGGFAGFLGTEDSFGASVADLGDLDGDGVTDLGVGALGDLDGGGLRRGALWVLFLDVDGTVKAHQKVSATHGGFAGDPLGVHSFGSAVTPVGDLDGDGITDLAVGARRAQLDGVNRFGAVWILFTGRPLPIRLGDRVEGVIVEKEVHAFTFAATTGTRIVLKAKRRDGELQPSLRLRDPAGNEILGTGETIKSLKLARGAIEVDETGTYQLEVLGFSGNDGEYALRTIPRFPRRISRLVAVDPQLGADEVLVDAVEGMSLRKLTVRSLRPKGIFAAVGGEAADLTPEVVSIDMPGGGAIDLEGHVKTSKSGKTVVLSEIDLPELGTYPVVIGGADDSIGFARVRGRLKAPRSKVTHEVP